MKKIYLLFLLLTSFLGAKAFDVTFSVDMNGTGLTDVSINGTFNGWCGYCTPMTDANADGIWEVTVPMTAGAYEYKFTATSGSAWETLAPGSSCTVTNFGFTNRSITVSADATLPTVCWQSCVSCSQAPPSYPVTFQVDMSNVTGFTTPTVNGSFDGWCGNCNPLTDANADGIWETTLSLPAGTYEYKFAYDNWAGQETLIAGNSCTVTNSGFTNRVVTVSAAATLDAVCWGSCVACSAVTPSYTVTFQLNMQEQTGYTTPEVNGTFNNWCGNCNPMTDANADGIWETTITLQAGTYEYKFSADGWGSQENLTAGSSCTVTNNGYTNRALNLNANTTLDIVCWGLCTDCAPPTYPVTFQVDMSNQTGFTTPEVNGTFNGWCGNCNPMTDANADGIWETTLNLPAGTYEYKFTADAWGSQENLTAGSSCTVTNGGYTNRALTVGAIAQTLPVVCWESCAACTVNTTPGCTDMSAVNYNPAAGTNDGSCLYATTFNVDMNCTDPFTNVYITGPWCGWCGADTYNLLTDANADGIYNVTVNLAAGNVEYKYMVDNWASQENLVDDVQSGGTCAPVTDGATYANRQIVVGTTTNDTYGQCSSCGGVVTDPCDLLTVAFDDAGSLASWTALADATLPEASMTWDATGALRISGSNTSPAIGKAYIFQYLNNAVNYNGNTTVELEFDVKSVGALVGTAVHLQTEFPGTGVTNTFDIQNAGINENTWTHYTYTFNGVTAASLFRMHFNMAAGAFVGAGGTLLIDNIELNCYTPVSIPGCTDPTALNYNAAATEDDGSCTYPVTYNVTFQVDMQNVTGFTTPEVNGTFNGWCGNCNAMTDANADGIWEVTVNIPAGNYEYKFAYDSWAGQETLTEGSSCTMTTAGFTNRTLSVSANTTLPVVCWESCAACTVNTTPGCTDMSAVNYNPAASINDGSCLYATQFNVDMNCAGVAFTNVYVTGPWCGWCGADTYNILTDADADGIYTVTVNLAAGNVEYKYMVDNWASQENLVDDMQNGGTCAPVTDYFNYANRQSPTGQVMNDVYGRCSACPVLGCTNASACNYNASATQDDGTCVLPTAYYSDADNDGYGSATATLLCAPAAGYVTDNTDCDDNTVTTNSAAIEICSNGIDDNCSGVIDEGCAPGENPYSAISTQTSTWPACAAVSGTLTGATASSTAQSICITGEDKWHQFVATSEGVSIVVNSTANDILIELQNASGTLITQENAVSGIGNEILNYVGLTAGQVYRIGVRNFDSSLGSGSYSICVKSLKRGGCAYGAGPYSLCQYFKAIYAGGTGSSYTFTFTGLTGPAAGNTYVRTQNTDICVLSNVLPLMPYGSTYNLLITNNYAIADGSGAIETISVPALGTCSVATIAEPTTTLRSSDRCTNGPKFRGAVVASLPWVCGVSNWRWRFQEVDLGGNPVGLPIEINRNAASNYLTLSTVAQLQNGKTYAVQTAPVFTYTGSNYNWGPAFNMCIIGTAGMVLDASQDVPQGSTKDAAQNAAQQMELSIYPNPSNGNNIQLMLSGMNTEVAQVRMIDAIGNLIWTNKFNTLELSNTSIELEQGLADGMYFIQVVSGKETISQRFLVRK